jgi:hypothetical protein
VEEREGLKKALSNPLLHLTFESEFAMETQTN